MSFRTWARQIPRLDAALIALTCFVTTVPPVANLLRYAPGPRLFSFVAADTFYYLTVARNIARTGKISFDGEHLTNGFHPLWQAVTAFAAIVVRFAHLGDIWLLGATFALGTLFTTLAVVLLGLALRRESAGLTPAFVLLPLGGATLVIAPFMRHFYGDIGRPSTSLWGAVNGMETSIVVAAYAASALAYVRVSRTPRGGVLLGACLGLLALARLDHAIFSFAIAASLFFHRRTEERRFAGAALGTLGAILGAYLLFNQLWFGVALPVSGTLKSTFPHTQDDGKALVLRVLLLPRSLVATYGHRALQLAVPALVAAVTLLVALVRFAWRASRPTRTPRSEDADRIEPLLLSTAVGVLGLFAYDYLFVPARNQGHWYFPVSHLFVSLVLIEGLRAVMGESARIRSVAFKATVGGGIAAASMAGYQAKLAQGEHIGSTARFFFEEAPKVRAFYGAHPPRLFEFDDGIITFSTGIPAMSGMGLAIDRDALPAARGLGSGRFDRSVLFEVGLARGYDRFATLVYGHGPLTRSSTTKQIREAYGGFLGVQAWVCQFEVEYLSTTSAFAVIRTTCPKRFHGPALRPPPSPALKAL